MDHEPWQSSNILTDDITCVELSIDDLALRGDFRIAVILIAILRGTWYRWLHPEARELWIRMIEGNDLTDDVWLWIDGDEEWLREHLGRGFLEDWLPEIKIPKGDWVDAQLALRRRLNQSRHPRNNAGNLRSERIRNATAEQRFAAIHWLTFSSNYVKDLAIELGRTPQGMFELDDMMSGINHVIPHSWDVFPQDSAAWEVAATKLEENGCTCLQQVKRLARLLRSWFNMLSWMDGKPPTMEVIGSYWACVRCESWCVQRFISSPVLMKDSPRAKSRYDRFRVDVQGTHLKVPLWDVLCLRATWNEDDDDCPSFAGAAFFSRLVGPGARQQVEQQLRSRLVMSDEQDVSYIPYINDHPHRLRKCAAWLSCTAGLPPCTEHLTQDASIDIPDGVLDDAPLAVILGATAWVAACLRSPLVENDGDRHDRGWHFRFWSTLYLWFESLTEYPPLKFSLEGLAFCAELYFDCHEHWEVFGKGPKHTLKTFVAVAIFLRNKNLLLHCCRRCQVLFARFFSDTALSASLGDLSLDSDDSGMSF